MSNTHTQSLGIFRGGTPIFNLGFIPEKTYITKEIMGDNFVNTQFEWDEQLDLRKGDYIYFGFEFEEVGLYRLTKDAFPTINKSTGGFVYDLNFHHFTERYKDFLFKFYPIMDDQGEAIISGIEEEEVEFNVTTTANGFVDLIAENLQKNGVDITEITNFQVDTSIADEVKEINFTNTDIFSAMTQIAEEYDTEWWFDNDNVFYLSDCIFGEEIQLEYDVDVDDISVNNSTERIITRLYAFGSDRNTTAGRLKIEPIDLFDDLHSSQIIEGVVTFDDIYPKQKTTISEIDYYVIGGPRDPGVVGVGIIDESEDPVYPRPPLIPGGPGGDGPQDPELANIQMHTNTEPEVGPDGKVKTYIYMFRSEDMLVKDNNDVMPGMPFMIAFTSGKLAGEEFELIIRYKKVEGEEEPQLWYEIKYREQEGIFPYVPNNVVKPEVGDEYFLFNIKAENVLPGLTQEAKTELRELARSYLESTKDNYVYDIDMRSITSQDALNDLDVGQRVMLIGPVTGVVSSRVQKYTKDVYNRYEASYEIGKKPKYSRLGTLEDTVNRSYHKMLNPASGSTDGYLTNLDWNRFDGKANKLINVLGVDGIVGGGNLGDNVILRLDWNTVASKEYVQQIVSSVETDKHYTQEVRIASNKWEVEHNLGKHPSVTVINDFQREVIGDIEYVDLNNIVIHFSASFSGTVICN